MTKHILTQSNYGDFSSFAAILVVSSDIIINVANVTYADGTIFEFAGGVISSSLSNGSTFLGNIQVVSGSMVRLFNKIKIPDMLNHEVPIEWFGGVCYANSPGSNPVLSDQAIADAVIAHRERKILFQAGNYVFSKTVAINRSGITLSGTKSFARQWNGFRQTSSDGRNSVSALNFTGSDSQIFFNISCDGIRMENLLLAGDYDYTAIDLSEGCMCFYADRCHFNKWGKGISRIGQENDEDSGLSRCIIENCTFSYIEGTAIEANVHYITYNIIRDCWFHLCRIPIKLVSINQLLQDNSIENCNFDHVRYDSSIYSTYGCCCAIYLESKDTNHTHATNNISRCYFERVGFDFDDNGNCIVPGSGCTNSAAVICRNCDITVDNNFFTSTPRLFLIDDCSSISIDDNGIGKNHTQVHDSTKYFLSHNAIVEVDHNILNKAITQVINYRNAVPIVPDTDTCFINKLVNFSADAAVSRFIVKNYYETRFTDYAPQMRMQESFATIYNSNLLQVDFDPSRYTGIGYNYHSFRMYIYLQYTVYCDIYDVTIDMTSFGGNARLTQDSVRAIYGSNGLLPGQDITIQTKGDLNSGRFYIHVNTPQMHPKFKVVINSDDVRVRNVTSLVDFSSIGLTANNITVRRHRGLTSTRPAFNATQSANSKGYEYYDTTNSRKSVWSGSRWLAYKTEPEGAATSGTTGQRPTSLLTTSDKGFTYFDTTLGKPVYWNGSGWVNANGTAS